MNLEGVLVEDRKKDTLLYAGLMQLRITDWFFLKEKADIEYIGLKDAIVHFNRTDSVWNYAFLEAYFSSPGGGKKKAGIEFNLKKVILENVSFVKKDAWIGADLYASVKGLNLDANDITISRKTINANNLILVDPLYHQYDYKGNRPDSLKKTVKAPTVRQTAALEWNPDNWSVIVDNVQITNGQFKTDYGSLKPSLSYFDGQHINFNGINGSVKNFHWVADTVRGSVNLSAKERSGLIVRKLQTDLRIHPQIMEFSNLLLKTNKSELQDYFAMKFSKISDMNDFIHAVTMVADFKDASIASDDLAFFEPQIKNWNRIFEVDGRVRGTVDALTGDDVIIRAGNSSSLSGDFSIVGLPNINATFINVEANELRTNYADAVTFAPALRRIKTPNLSRLGAVRFKGTYTGFINDFVTYGTITTALGTVQSDLNMKLPANGTPIYSGSLATNGFKLGAFLNDPKIGAIAFSGSVKGRSFDWNTLDATVDATVRSFQYGTYTYQNITAKGRLANKTFDGIFNIKDPNADLRLDGRITFSGTEPAFDVKAFINKANLKALQLTREDVSLNGAFNLAFKGNNIGDFLGNANLNNISFTQGGKQITLDSLIISSTFINGIRSVRARSTEFDATVTGQFDLKSLPDAVTLFLSRYYPSYIKPSRRTFPNQNFTFDITTGVVEDYVKLIDSRLSGFNNAHITGSLNVAANSLILNADVPLFGFNRYSFADVQLNGVGNLDSLSLRGKVNNAIISDSLIFPQTDFVLLARNDVSDININTTSNQTINRAALSAQIKTFSNGASVLFNPSSFVLNGKTWSIDQGGELDFRKNSVVQGSVVLRESNQEVRLSTQPSDVGNWNDLHIALQNLNIGDISPFLTKNIRIEGALNGSIVIEDPQHRLNIAANVSSDRLRIDNDSIGQIQAAVNYSNSTGLISGSGFNLDPEHKIAFDLSIDLKDSAKQHKDRIVLKPTRFPVKILERFIGTLFSDLQGYLTGTLNIEEGQRDWNFIGKARLEDAGLKVNFTQVFYKIDDTEIELKENEIDFGRLKLRDRFGNTATVRGSIQHQSFGNMYFDIEAKVDNNPMELLNTSYNDNQQFYGRAMGNGFMNLIGPQSNMNMYIEATPSTRDSSYITLPPSRTREGGQASFMVERKYGREMTREDLATAATNINYVVSLDANPMVTVEVILDELTGDVIKGRGVGHLEMKAGTNTPLSLRGRYDIQEGYYLYTFQSFFKKPFVLRPASNNYIEWTGDPYTAQIKFDAVYTAENVSFTPLASSLSLNNNFKTYRGDVNVVALFTGELFKPTFSFKIEFPENSAARNDPSVAFGIQQIERNINEINKQVTYLIVFNSFAPYESTQTTYNPLNEFAYSTISGLFFGEINKRLNQLLGKLLQNNKLTFNFTGSLYNRNLIDQNTKGFKINQGSFNISFGKSFLNERAQIAFGGTVDVPLESDLQQVIRFLPDVSVSFLINKSGSLRATLFYSENTDLLINPAQVNNNQNRRAGAKLSYRKEFSSLSEILFGRKKGKRKENRQTKDTTNTFPAGGK